MAIQHGPFGAGSQLGLLVCAGRFVLDVERQPPSASYLNCGSIGELSR
jgi:hypothetical protein